MQPGPWKNGITCPETGNPHETKYSSAEVLAEALALIPK